MRTTCKAVLLAAASFIILASAFAQSQVAKTIPNSTSPEGLIGFLEFKPNDYGSQKHPLIIFLHGVVERGNGTSQIGYVAYNSLPNTLQTNQYNMRFTVNGQTSSFVVISPQLSTAYGYWPSWYISEIIKYAKANLSIDPNRIYVTGLSLGGGGVLRMMTDAYGQDPSFDSQIAAVAPVCSTPEQSDADYCRTVGANHLPIWAFHCMDDINVSPSVTQHIQALSQACGVTPTSKFSFYAYGGHGGAWINAYDFGHITTLMGDGSTVYTSQNLFEWFLSNPRNGIVTPPSANTPPNVSVSGAQTITLPNSAVTVVGSAAGTNGASIIGYNWTQTGGPAGALIVSAGSTTTNINNLTQGTYTFTFTAKDNNGLTSSANVVITVNPAAGVNTPPTVSVSGAQTITLPSNAVTITGSAAGTNGATISSYAWTQSSGPAGDIIVSPGSTTTNVTGLTQGTYVFTLTARDNNNLTASGNVAITVNPATGTNQSTASNAGGNVTIALPVTSVSLDGSTSTGNIVQYYWYQAQGPVSAPIANNFSAVTTATGLTTVGTYVFGLQVIDNSGLHAYGYKTVTVSPSGTATVPACVTNTSPANGSTLTTQATATLTWPAASTATSYDVYLQAGTGIPATLVTNTAALSYSASGLSAGTTYSWYIAPKNASGAATGCVTTNKTTFTTAVAGSQPIGPNAGGNVTITLPTSSVTLDGSASTGTIAQYYWYQAQGPVSTPIANNFSTITTANNLTVAGTYVFGLQVKDNLGVPTYAYKTVTVKAAGTREADAGTLAGSTALSATGNPLTPGAAGKLVIMYPNPVVNSTTIELNSDDEDVKKISLYNSTGILVNSYRWLAVRGRNIYSLKNIAGLAKGLYIIQITDSKGKANGTLKFIKS